MKKTVTSIFLLVLSLSSFAQIDEAIDATERREKMMDTSISDTGKWNWGGNLGLQFGQTSLKNWSAGGNSQISVAMTGKAYANFTKKKNIWENSFIGDWGIVRFKGESPQISANYLEINSQYGYKLKKKLFFGVLTNFQSQFTWGFEYPEDKPKVLISKFAAPAFVKAAVGFDYKPSEVFSVFISPTAGKFTFVREDPRIDEVTYGLDTGATVRSEFGAFLRANFRKELFTNVTLFSTLELFNNYTDPNKPNRKNIDVNWQTGIDMKINSWLAASLFTHVIYDQDLLIPVDRDGDGEFESEGPRTQFRQTFTLGITYNFGSKKEDE